MLCSRRFSTLQRWHSCAICTGPASTCIVIEHDHDVSFQNGITKLYAKQWWIQDFEIKGGGQH